MSGRHHTETQSGGSAPSPIGTLVIATFAVVAIIAGVATIVAWVVPAASGDDDTPEIVVQPSASLSDDHPDSEPRIARSVDRPVHGDQHLH